MSTKPSDLFIGVADFFSILLPGAALTFIGLRLAARLEIPKDHFLWDVLQLSGSSAWAAFLLAAYVLGHVIASLGTSLDPLYDARKTGHRNQALANAVDSVAARIREPYATPGAGRTLPPTKASRFARMVDAVLLWMAWRSGAPPEGTEERQLPTETWTNGYKLACTTLALRAPVLSATVDRLEADSKFFRSLVILAALAMPLCVGQLVWDIAVLSMKGGAWERVVWGASYALFVFAVLRIAFVRFCELRLKATETAFRGLLLVHAQPQPQPNGTDLRP